MAHPLHPVALFVLLTLPASPVAAQYYPREGTVQDLRNGIEWMRCSVGQLWQPEAETCTGDAARISHAAVPEAVAAAEALYGPGWRLPTLDELESLVCNTCPPPMIRADLFPATAAEPYWTSEKNFMAPRNVYSVNFMTGHSYGRFFPNQDLAVRLVRDRQR